MKRENLVIVRAGDSSLHPEWLAGPDAEPRTWDIIVNYFGDDPEKYRVEDTIRIDSKGPKWPALFDLIRDHAGLIGRYERVWLPDDDLRCTCEDINRLFAIFEREELELAQPALRHGSYIAHMVTLYNPSFRLRYTNFIEIMAPCFTGRALARLLPTFNENLSGWGLDYVWPAFLGSAGSQVAIIDDVQVLHTRPIGAANYGVLKARGITAWDEMNQSLERHSVPKRGIVINRAIVRKTGKVVPRGMKLLYLYAAGLLSAGPHFKAGFPAFVYGWLSAIKHQLRN